MKGYLYLFCNVSIFIFLYKSIYILTLFLDHIKCIPDDCGGMELKVVYKSFSSTPYIIALNLEHSAEDTNNYLYIYIYIYIYASIYIYGYYI